MKRAAAFAFALLLLVVLVWIGGELHIENCRRDGQIGCSVLPWSGHKPPSTGDAGGIDWSKVKIP